MLLVLKRRQTAGDAISWALSIAGIVSILIRFYTRYDDAIILSVNYICDNYRLSQCMAQRLIDSLVLAPGKNKGLKQRGVKLATAALFVDAST